MLQYIRSNVQGTMAKIIVAIIIVPFAIFGIESLVGRGGDAAAAVVNGEKIGEAELTRMIRQQQQRLLASMGEQIDPSMLDESRLRQPALESLITRELLKQHVEALGFGYAEPAVDRMLTSLPQFQEEGRFSPERYRTVVRESGYLPAEFKRRVRTDLMIEQLYSGVALSEFVTPAELERVVALGQQRRSFDYVVIPVAKDLSVVTITDADIEKYYQENTDIFMQPEQVQLEYIELKGADFVKPVDEAAIAAEYEREKAAFAGGIERHAAHILIEIGEERDETQAQALAEQLAAELAAGADFAALAKKYSDDLGSRQSGGDLGVSRGDTFPKPFEKALAALQPGEVSRPVRTEAGIHLIKLLDQRVERFPPLTERRAAIAERLAYQSAQPELLKTVERLRDLVFNADDLKQPARELGLEVRRSGWLQRSNDDPLLGNPRLMAAAFSDEVLKERNNSDVIELAADHFVVVRVADHAPAAPRPLAAVRGEVEALLKRQRMVEDARQRAKAMQQALRDGAELKELVAATGLALRHGRQLQRNATGDIDGKIISAAFSLPRPSGNKQPTAVTQTGDGDVALVQLREVVDGSLTDMDSEMRRMIVAQLRRGNGEAVFAAYLDAVRGAAEIERP
jgi:peptidyl-prolyl cis-trans isomerase D